MQVARESRHRGHTDDDFIRLTILVCTHDSLDDCGADLVLDWALGVVGRGDEELVLNVNEMLRVVDDLDVGVGDGVL